MTHLLQKLDYLPFLADERKRAQIEFEAKRAEYMLNSLFTYLTAPNLDSKVRINDLVQLLKTLVHDIDANKDDEEITKQLADVLMKQMLDRGANVKNFTGGNGSNEVSVLQQVDDYFLRTFIHMRALEQFVRSFRHDYELRGTNRHFKSAHGICSCDKIPPDDDWWTHTFFLDNRRYGKGAIESMLSQQKNWTPFKQLGTNKLQTKGGFGPKLNRDLPS